MKKFFLTAGVAYILTLTLVPNIVFGDESTAATGQLIDEMTAKNSGVVTAESALPEKFSDSKKNSKKEIKIEAPKNVEATQPVFTNPTATVVKPTESSSTLVRLSLSLLILGILGGGAYYFLKKWPGAQKLKTRNKMIEVLNQQYLGPKKSLAVIRVAGEAVLIGITENNISLLKNLSLLDEEIPQENREAQFTLKNQETQKFQKTLNSSMGNSTMSAPREEEFSMTGIKEIIGGKLKGMREF